MAKEKVKKPFFKKWWFWLIAVILVLIVFTGGDDEDDKGPKKVDEETSTEVAQDQNDDGVDESAEEEIEDKEFNVGEKVELDGQVVEVTKVEKSSGDDFDKPKEGHEYVIVHVAIENNSDENISYNPFNFKMQNSAGQIESQTFTIVDNDTSLSSGELSSGGHVQGTIAFEQPIGDGELKLIFEPSFWNTDQIIFNLQ